EARGPRLIAPPRTCRVVAERRRPRAFVVDGDVIGIDAAGARLVVLDAAAERPADGDREHARPAVVAPAQPRALPARDGERRLGHAEDRRQRRDLVVSDGDVAADTAGRRAAAADGMHPAKCTAPSATAPARPRALPRSS